MKTQLLIISFFLNMYAMAQGDQSSYKAYMADPNFKELWKQEVLMKSNLSKRNPSDNRNKYDLALAHLGLLSATMRDQDESLFDDYYDEAVDNLQSIISEDKKWAEPMAVLSAIYGLKLGYSPWQGMFLGPKSSNLIEKAKELAPQSALVWKIYANSKFFTPEMWGGDIKEAIASYEKSIQLYEKETEGPTYNWMYMDAIAFLGQAYLKNGEPTKAVSTFEKALAKDPDFGWVRFVLLPQAQAKSN